MTNILPTTKWARGSIAGTATLKVGGKHLKHIAKRPFLSVTKQKEDKQRLEDETAELIFKTFTQLRGTALKIAQILSMETAFLPESFRKELSKSYYQVPPLGRALARKLMQQEFGKPPEELFTHFNPQAFAAASLGQVHSAHDEYGNELAIKLQYPGINITIDSDLQLVRSLVKRTLHAELLLSALDEIGQRLREEVNYEQEANHTEWFRQHLNLPNVIIPPVYRNLSAKRILTTGRLNGVHLEQWLQLNPSQESRNHFAQLMHDVFVQSFYGLQALHADPNPGNYLFTDDGILGLLDFGCVRYFSQEFVTLLPELLRAYMDHNADTVIGTYEKLGMVAEMSPNELQAFFNSTLQPFGDWLTKPFKVEAFDFGDRDSPYTSEGWKLMGQITDIKKINSMAKSLKTTNKLANEFIFFNRTFFGLYQIFERMGATVRMQHQWML